MPVGVMFMDISALTAEECASEASEAARQAQAKASQK